MEDTISKHHSKFLYKAIIFAIFVYILTLFSPQFSEDQQGNWELIQLILVGIAVSFGIFSRKNDESEENSPKLDETKAYLTNFSHVSTFFHDETHDHSECNENYSVEMWKAQYLKSDPLVVLEKENSVSEKQRSTTSEIGENPLFLPVRRLKSRNYEAGQNGSLIFAAKVEENSLLKSLDQCDLKPDLSKTEMNNKINEAPLFPLPSSSRSYESKPRDMIGKRSETSLKGAKLGKSVRTIRKCKSNSRELENIEFVEEKGTDLVSERKACLQIFDFRDYEKGINYKSEGFNCNNDSCEGRDVNKKAAEFIAKFREQIRLQE